MEGLEERVLLSVVSQNGTTLTIDLAQNDALSVLSVAQSGIGATTLGNGPYYQFLLAGAGTFTNAPINGANPGLVSGFGSDTLRVNSSGINYYTTIDITDTYNGTAATGTSVVFSDSGTATYLASFNVTLNNNPEPGNVQIISSTFTGSAGLDVVTAGGIEVFEVQPAVWH